MSTKTKAIIPQLACLRWCGSGLLGHRFAVLEPSARYSCGWDSRAHCNTLADACADLQPGHEVWEEVARKQWRKVAP